MAKFVQYVIVRGDLIEKMNWPIGAVIAQCCHATTAISHLFKDDPDTQEYFEDLDNMHKVVLKAPDEETLKNLHQLLDENDVKHKMWIEMPENIPTCIAIKPYKKDDVFRYVRKFKLFK